MSLKISRNSTLINIDNLSSHRHHDHPQHFFGFPVLQFILMIIIPLTLTVLISMAVYYFTKHKNYILIVNKRYKNLIKQLTPSNPSDIHFRNDLELEGTEMQELLSLDIQDNDNSYIDYDYKNQKDYYNNDNNSNTTGVTILLATIIYQKTYDIKQFFLAWLHVRHWSYVQYITIAIGLLQSCFYMPLSYIKPDFLEGKFFKNNPQFLKRIGCVIPCHNSANEIGEVLKKVLRYIPPENIIVVDNGNENNPPDRTFEIVRLIHHKISYCYVKQAHKTRALWTGAHRLPSHIEYILHLDDDTLLSDNMVFDESLFYPKNKNSTNNGETHNESDIIAISFLRSTRKTNIHTKFIDFWYKANDHYHLTQSCMAGTRAFVPGPAGLWRRDKFLEVYAVHPSLPFGEDIFGGYTAINLGYRLTVEHRCM
eukprot:gene16654-22765_t